MGGAGHSDAVAPHHPAGVARVYRMPHNNSLAFSGFETGKCCPKHDIVSETVWLGSRDIFFYLEKGRKLRTKQGHNYSRIGNRTYGLSNCTTESGHK